jgi:hypothetical protein
MKSQTFLIVVSPIYIVWQENRKFEKLNEVIESKTFKLRNKA